MQSHDTPWSTIPELIDDAARRFPDDEAVVDDDERWTFAELADRVHEAARALIASGDRAGRSGRHLGAQHPRVGGRRPCRPTTRARAWCRSTRDSRAARRATCSRARSPDPLHGHRLPRRRLRERGAGRRRRRVAGGDRGAARHGARRYGRVRPTSSHAAPRSTTPHACRARRGRPRRRHLPHPLHVGHDRRAEGRDALARADLSRVPRVRGRDRAARGRPLPRGAAVLPLVRTARGDPVLPDDGRDHRPAVRCSSPRRR